MNIVICVGGMALPDPTAHQMDREYGINGKYSVGLVSADTGLLGGSWSSTLEWAVGFSRILLHDFYLQDYHIVLYRWNIVMCVGGMALPDPTAHQMDRENKVISEKKITSC